MHTKRGGRVQVNMMQFYELVERVDKLEQLLKEKVSEPEEGHAPTKPEVMASLDEKGIKYNPRDKKDVLIGLLNKGQETCQEDQTE